MPPDNTAMPRDNADRDTRAALRARIDSGGALVGIIGLGYVGLPVARAFVERGVAVLGFDTDAAKVARLARGESYIGFQAFYPGPGLGGHCIPIDPFYLSWIARRYHTPMRFIELAGEINTAMPGYVVSKIIDALNERGKPIRGSRILLLGMAYKRDVDDPRESPGFELMDLLMGKGGGGHLQRPAHPQLAADAQVSAPADVELRADARVPHCARPRPDRHGPLGL